MRAGISRKTLKSNKTAIKASAQDPLETDVLACSDFSLPLKVELLFFEKPYVKTREENHSPLEGESVS